MEPDKKVRALSKGNRQKIQLVHACSTRADLLILDVYLPDMSGLERGAPFAAAP